MLSYFNNVNLTVKTFNAELCVLWTYDEWSAMLIEF